MLCYVTLLYVSFTIMRSAASKLLCGPHAPVNMAESMEEENVGEKKKPARNCTFAALYCAMFCAQSFRKSLKFIGTSTASLDPKTVDLPAFSILSAMFTGACSTPETRFGTALVQDLWPSWEIEISYSKVWLVPIVFVCFPRGWLYVPNKCHLWRQLNLPWSCRSEFLEVFVASRCCPPRRQTDLHLKNLKGRESNVSSR